MFIQPTISNNEQKLPFQAKFLNSEAMKQIADYAVERGKFDKLNQARKILILHVFRQDSGLI